MKHYLIYIPGLGDTRPMGQDLAVKAWRIFGVKSEYFPMYWSDSESFESKLKRLVRRTEELNELGYAVSLVGSSAGGGAAINAFAVTKDKVHRVVGICPAINGADEVNPKTYVKNPAFKESMYAVAESLKELNKEDRSRIMSIHPLKDEVVWLKNTLIEGAKEKRILTFGHAFSIAYSITLGMPKIIRFIK